MLTRQIDGLKIVSIRVHKVKHKEKVRKNRSLNTKRMIGFGLLLILFVNSCVIEANAESTNVCGSDRIDGPVFYDAAKSICCDGQIHPLWINGSKYGCCTRKGKSGNETQELYDKSVKLCCGPQLVPLYNGWYERRCCKGSDEDQFPGEVLEHGSKCCNGRTFKLTGNEDCCGTMKYDTSKHTCCNSRLRENNASFASPACCGEQLFDENTHKCDESEWPPVVLESHIYKCAGKVFDSRTDVCCDDEKGPILKKPVPKSWWNSQAEYIEYICCNDALYDRNDSQCCQAIPEKSIVEHPIEKGYSCCGNGSVKKDYFLERCCNGVANKIQDYVPGDPWVPHSCCGTKYVKDGRCCNGKEMAPEYACCGTVEYSRNSAQDCCGTDVFDRNHEVCCKRSSTIHFPIDKNRADDTDCCMPAEVPYNRHTHNCTQAGVLEKPETREAPILHCPFCRRKTKPSSYCSARNVFEVTVKRVRFTDKGSVLSARMNKEKIKIRIPYRCPACIRPNTEYLVFTNRRVKQGKLRLKSKSTFFRKDDFTLKQVNEVCDVKQKIRRTVRRLAREAVKKAIG